jgi:hypothetical protein
MFFFLLHISKACHSLERYKSNKTVKSHSQLDEKQSSLKSNQLKLETKKGRKSQRN